MAGLRLGAALAVKSMLRQPLPHIVACIAIISVLTPLMLLYGVRTGVVDGMLASIRSDPRVLELNVSGNVSLTPQQVAEIAALPEAGFVVGSPRSTSSWFELEVDRDGETGFHRAELVPTGPGDPVTARFDIADLSDDQIVLSEALAARLRAAPGDTLIARRARQDGVEMSRRVEVVGILPSAFIETNRAIVTYPVLETLEAFIDGYEIEALGLPGRPIGERAESVSRLRIAAKSLDGVVALSRAVEALGLRAVGKQAEIALVQNLDTIMTTLFAFISAVGILGYVFAFWASLVSVFEQYRRHTALIRLLGLDRAGLAAFPLTQALSTSVIGVAVSFILFLLVSGGINGYFPATVLGSEICVLRPVHFAIAAGATLVVAIVVALRMVVVFSRVSPAEAIKDA